MGGYLNTRSFAENTGHLIADAKGQLLDNS